MVISSVSNLSRSRLHGGPVCSGAFPGRSEPVAGRLDLFFDLGTTLNGRNAQHRQFQCSSGPRPPPGGGSTRLRDQFVRGYCRFAGHAKGDKLIGPKEGEISDYVANDKICSKRRHFHCLPN